MRRVTTAFVASVLGLTAAYAGSSDPFTANMAEEAVKRMLGGETLIPIKFDSPGMSGFTVPSQAGRPVFYFCFGKLVNYWTQVEDGDLPTFRHIVEDETRNLGSKPDFLVFA